MTESQWDAIAFPTLKLIRDHENDDDSDGAYSTHELAEDLGIEDLSVVGRQLQSLQHDGYIQMADFRAGGGNRYTYAYFELLPRGRRAVGEWPSDRVEVLIAAFDGAAASHSGTTRRLLKNVADTLKQLPQSAVSGAMEALVQSGLS